jgi:catechol 2,3-dioxygenase-like lactoylglutathione lyase family enzyme
MQLSRSSHIAVRVPADELDAAVAHYKALLGVEEKSREGGEVELVGPNFILWVDGREGSGPMLQEFNATDAAAARAAVERSQAKIVGESSSGFYVQDPYGSNFHVYIESAPG